MDISTIVFFISLFVLLVAAISTELIGDRHMRAFYLGILFLNSVCFLAGVALFVQTHSPVYTIIGMLFSLAVLGVTCVKYSNF